jgi:peptidoglycan/xylan/chitin deacetylase (PgdA/CDA1 family)
MDKNFKSLHPYPWRWLIKAMVIPITIALVTAFQVSSVVAPSFLPALATPLVSFSVVVFPTRPPSPTATDVPPTVLPTQTPLPTATETRVPATPTSTPAQTPTPTVRPTPTLAFSRPISVPLSAPTPNDAKRVASMPILMYHYISVPPAGSDRYRLSLSVTPANFDAQMAYLKQAGYHAVTLYDLYAYLAQGQALPDKPVILTFDDGYVDAFTQAMPILHKYGFVGTFFVLTGPADESGAGEHLTWEQIAAMSATGMDIELHSREHFDLRNRPNDFLIHQIAGGKESLEAHINLPVRWFAYPSGRYDAAVVRVLKSDGFWGAVTTKDGRTHTASGFFDLQRVRIEGSYTLNTFVKLVTEGP